MKINTVIPGSAGCITLCITATARSQIIILIDESIKRIGLLQSGNSLSRGVRIRSEEINGLVAERYITRLTCWGVPCAE